MARIQLITICTSILFLVLVSRLIIKGKLREEYAIVWLISTVVLILFSVWEGGLRKIADLFGVDIPTNLIFASSIFIILVYLLHLSLVASKLQQQNKLMAQEIALLKQDVNGLKADKEKQLLNNE